MHFNTTGHHSHTLHIARAYHHVGTLVEGRSKAQQIVGVVRKVAIHLEDVVETLFEPPTEAGKIGRSEAEFATALNHNESVGVGGHQGADNVGCAVGRAVVDDEQRELSGERKDLRHHSLDVLTLVVGWYDY